MNSSFARIPRIRARHVFANVFPWAPFVVGAAVFWHSFVLSAAETGSLVEVLGGGEGAEEAGRELEGWLEKTRTVPEEEVTVRLGLMGEDGWPESLQPWIERLKEEKALEAYATVTDRGSNTVYLVGRDPRALFPAVYGFLDALGFRWFFPGEKWTHIPESVKALDIPDGITVPDFRGRRMFGTGGWGPPGLPPDPEREVMTEVDAWMRHNRLGGEHMSTGHAGDHIMQRHREVFEQHPEWRAQVDGKPVRIPERGGIHFNYGNPEFQAWYAQNRVEELERLIERNPETLVVSTDPADGPKPHGDSPESLALGNGSVSDRVFTLTNVAARAVAEKYPDKYVGINAYNQHADVPSIELEPNVYVQVIPYAFQRTGLSAEELIAAWGEKMPHGNLGVYDYWNIPDWARCQPLLDYDRTLPEKLRFWKDSNLDRVNIEGVWSNGSLGLPAYIAFRMMWNMDLSPTALADEFFEEMFGPAQEPVRKMYDRWAEEFLLTPQEIALSYRDLKEAMRLAEGRPEIRSRIRDFIGYVFYLQRLLEFEEARKTDGELDAAKRWIEAMWAIHPSGMAQTYRMHKLAVMRYVNAENKEILRETWMPVGDSPGWENWEGSLTDDAIDRILGKGIEEYPVLYETAHFDIDHLVPAGAKIDPGAEWMETSTRYGRGRYAVLQSEESPVRLSVRATAKTDIPLEVTVSRLGESGGEASRLLIPPGDKEDWTDIPIPPESGVYEVQATPRGVVYHAFRANPQARLTALDRIEERLPRSLTRFYVPRGQKQVAFYTPQPGPDPMKFLDGDGNPVPFTGGYSKILEVPPGQDGKIWSVQGHAGGRADRMIFLNGPRVYGFGENDFLIPAGLAPESHNR